MTPQEIALELYNKLYSTNSHPNSAEVRKEYAKETALVAVNEVIRAIIIVPSNYGASWEYWSQVKQEIEKL